MPLLSPVLNDGAVLIFTFKNTYNKAQEWAQQCVAQKQRLAQWCKEGRVSEIHLLANTGEGGTAFLHCRTLLQSLHSCVCNPICGHR